MGRRKEGRGVNVVSPAKTDLPSFAKALKALARLEEEVDRAETFLELDEISNVAAGLQRRYRRLPEVANRAGIVVVRAEAKVGAERAAMPKATGVRLAGKDSFGGPIMEPPKDAPLSLSWASIRSARRGRKSWRWFPSSSRAQSFNDWLTKESRLRRTPCWRLSGRKTNAKRSTRFLGARRRQNASAVKRTLDR
jgi:hypothetical protein